MAYLLDTHVLIWFIEGDVKLSATSRQIIENESVSCFVSIVSFWEMAIKVSLGNLKLHTTFDKYHELVLKNDIQILDIDFEHTTKLSQLPFYHRDPFDRTLIAQALVADLTLISKEKLFDKYGVKRFW